MTTARLFLLTMLAAVVCRAAAPTHFNWRRDTIAFSNDTVFSYGIDEAGHLTMHRRAVPARFAHRCFVLARAVLQFHKFARFAPDQPQASDEGYRRLLVHLFRISAWMPARPAQDRIVIPGYADLNDFSRGREHLMKETMGNWFPTYLRVGNWRMIGPFPRFGQANAYAQLVRGLDRGKLEAVYLTRFPKMNHCVILFDYHIHGNITRFDAYDPNYPNTLSWVEYDAKARGFNFERRWFWPGGRVNLMRVYLSPFH
ncbi:MAG TPA: hypothetical protein VHY22_15570 [Chthoniobacteraceae bacterium]|jgi:hypothetical protein|nr:hypothetical protein [Chthoniobacteraceae bacterium]